MAEQAQAHERAATSATERLRSGDWTVSTPVIASSPATTCGAKAAASLRASSPRDQ